jgi:hypothetical protein
MTYEQAIDRAALSVLDPARCVEFMQEALRLHLGVAEVPDLVPCAAIRAVQDDVGRRMRDLLPGALAELTGDAVFATAEAREMVLAELDDLFPARH